MEPDNAPTAAVLDEMDKAPVRVEEARFMAETLLRAIPGMEIVAVVPAGNDPIPGFSIDPLIDPEAVGAFAEISELVRAQLDGESRESFSCVIEGIEWGVLVDDVKTSDTTVVGALVMARHGRVWSSRERGLTEAFGGVLSLIATQAMREKVLLHQKGLDELVSQVAESLMSSTRAKRQETLTWTVRVLAEFLGADVAFLRSHDHKRGLSILEAEWPLREWSGPGEDPLGEVRFDSDPIFTTTQHLREPYFPGVPDDQGDFLERVEAGSGVPLVDGGAVPLLMDGETWGVLAFLHFNKHQWVAAEIRALQAVASMLVQFQGRLDAESRIIYNANHDELTGLANRRGLVAELEKRLSGGKRTAVMVIDLDRFKVMNDFLGHGAGDRLLVTIADRLRTSSRVGDFVARLGGDEFVFLVDDAVSEMEVLAGAHRMHDLIAEPVEIQGQTVSHTASIGIAMPERDAATGLEILGRADVAMYAAKTQGRNLVVVFDDALKALVNERSQTELLLAEGIENGGLRLHFQPEVDLNTGKLLAVESLVRWQHPTKGLVAAGEFIKVAEETGLVSAIGRWVFNEACRQLSVWEKEYPELKIAVRVNMSPADFKFDDLVEFVEGCIKTHNVPPGRICIEVTEHVVLYETENTAHILKGFRELGVEVAIDDFGTGFASMTELKNLPVDFLKLDMSFVKGITNDRYDRAIVESITSLARALDLGAIAEGIEDTDIAEELLVLGCHRGQGYLIAKPMSAEDLIPILQAGGVPLDLIRTNGAATVLH